MLELWSRAQAERVLSWYRFHLRPRPGLSAGLPAPLGFLGGLLADGVCALSWTRPCSC